MLIGFAVSFWAPLIFVKYPYACVYMLWELQRDKVIGSHIQDFGYQRLITSLNYPLQIHYTLIADVDRAASGVNDDTIASPTREPEPSLETPRQNVNISAGICRARPTFQTAQRCCSRDRNPLTSYWSISRRHSEALSPSAAAITATRAQLPTPPSSEKRSIYTLNGWRSRSRMFPP